MDRIVAVIVRLMVAIAGFAEVLPGMVFDRWRPGQVVKILLVGYNGARNTGSDVRVADLACRLLPALDYAYEHRETLSTTLSSNVESSVSTLHDMGLWFVDYVQSGLTQ